jgi:hypothetical protein
MLGIITSPPRGVFVKELCSQLNLSQVRISERITEGIYLGKKTANILSSTEQRTLFVRFVARLAMKLLRVLGGETSIASCSEHLSLPVRNKVLKRIGSVNFRLGDWIIQRVSTQTSAAGILKSIVIISSVDCAHTYTVVLFTKLSFSKPMVIYFNIS